MELHMMYAPMIQQYRDELTQIGFKELRTPEEVADTLPHAQGVSLVFVNSVCGCAGGIARPGAALALKSGLKAANLYTVFAGQDKEATAKAREYFVGYAPSSPSIAVLKDGKIATMIERRDIEGSSPQAVAAKVASAVSAAGA